MRNQVSAEPGNPNQVDEDPRDQVASHQCHDRGRLILEVEAVDGGRGETGKRQQDDTFLISFFQRRARRENFKVHGFDQGAGIGRE